MLREADFRAKAEEAERLATRASSEAERAAYKQIAQGWRDLEARARQDSKRDRP